MNTKMKSSDTKYRCAKCDNEFIDYWYNLYEFNSGSFVTCPNCNAKLVINFNFRSAVKLNNLYLILSAIILVLVLISMFFWSFKSVGIYILIVSSIILIPLSFFEDYIRAPELFPIVKKTIELDSNNDS